MALFIISDIDSKMSQYVPGQYDIAPVSETTQIIICGNIKEKLTLFQFGNSFRRLVDNPFQEKQDIAHGMLYLPQVYTSITGMEEKSNISKRTKQIRKCKKM